MDYSDKTKNELISEIEKLRTELKNTRKQHNNKREQYLEILNQAKKTLFTSISSNAFQDFLEIIGKVLNSSRIYIFINHTAKNGQKGI